MARSFVDDVNNIVIPEICEGQEHSVKGPSWFCRWWGREAIIIILSREFDY